MRRSITVLGLVIGLLSGVPAFAQGGAAQFGFAALAGDDFGAIGLAALQNVRQRADDGDSGAAMILSRYLLGNSRTDAEKAEGLTRLFAAADAGIAEALTRRADILRSGQFGVPADPTAAAGFYEQALLQGDNGARRGLASLLIAGNGIAADTARAVMLLEEAIASGDVSAATQLAGLYAQGTWIEPDAERAVALYGLGIAIANTSAINGLGDLYRAGKTMPADPETALALYGEAARIGDGNAQKKFADMRVKGEGGPADAAGGIAMLETLAPNDSSAFVTIGDYYARGIGVAIDAARAADYYQRGVDADNAQAAARLAQLNYNGAPGVDRDFAKAFALYSAAGDASSKRLAAEMLARGQGTPSDVAGAIATLERLGADGDAAAWVLAGDLLARGEVIRPDAAKAATLYQQASEAGSAAGAVRLADLYRNGSINGARLRPQPQNAVPLYEKAIALDDNSARRALSALLLRGAPGVPADAGRAVALLEDAAAKGDATAYQQLGVVFSSGDPLPADYERAVAAFAQSVSAGNPSARVRGNVAVANGPLAEVHGEQAIADLQKAIGEGVPGAALELARLQIAGLVPGAGAGDVVATLQPAIDADNVAAIRFLIGFYRDGVGSIVEPNPAAATALISDKEQVLGRETAALERIYLAAKLPPTPAVFDKVNGDLELLTPPNAISAVMRLRGVSKNVYVHVLQTKLAELGLYTGKRGGTLDGKTIKVLQTFCEDAGIRSACDLGPLDVQASSAIARALFLPRL
ncbi:tetratricopeptide repeat protein [uncultured Devosia sp.]|uniref:tetratricopeptide repeat protein n=1 Tax=uncultured Devosia sp. TaxID=211434 RepID=UPI0035CC2405